MSRALTNDHLATRARDRAKAAKPESRERRAWETVARALEDTGTAEGARVYLLSLSISTLRNDALRMLNGLAANCG